MGSGRLDGQAPQQTVLERIESQALQQATGDIPAYFSNGISSKDASDLTALMAECVSLYAGVSHTKPRIVLAVLDETAWAGLKGPAPYGLPHHTWTETPYVVIVPSTWANVPPVFATTRKHLVDALGANGVDVYILLEAVDEAMPVERDGESLTVVRHDAIRLGKSTEVGGPGQMARLSAFAQLVASLAGVTPS